MSSNISNFIPRIGFLARSMHQNFSLLTYRSSISEFLNLSSWVGQNLSNSSSQAYVNMLLFLYLYETLSETCLYISPLFYTLLIFFFWKFTIDLRDREFLAVIGSAVSYITTKKLFTTSQSVWNFWIWSELQIFDQKKS